MPKAIQVIRSPKTITSESIPTLAYAARETISSLLP